MTLGYRLRCTNNRIKYTEDAVIRKVEKFQDEFRHDLKLELNPSLTEPFRTVRNASHLMFDFGAMTSLLNYETYISLQFLIQMFFKGFP